MAFSKFHLRHFELVSKYNVKLKTLLLQGLSDPEFYGDLVYKFRKIIGKYELPYHFKKMVGWLFFGLNGPLRQYFSLYRAVSEREGERKEMIDERKNVQTTPTRTYCKRSRPLPYLNQYK